MEKGVIGVEGRNVSGADGDAGEWGSTSGVVRRLQHPCTKARVQVEGLRDLVFP
jgi:hypothetical protein